MTEVAFRASDELAAALREHIAADRAFRPQVLEFDREHPGHEVLWARSPFSADMHAMGFNDGTDDVPEGLSRAKSRRNLAPARGKAGEPWRQVLARMEKRPRVERVWHRFDVPSYGRSHTDRDGREWLAPTLFHDCGADGVIVWCAHDIEVDRNGKRTRAEHLTPMKLSEFHAIRERIEAKEVADQPA